MPAPVTPNLARLLALNELVDTGNLYDGAKVHLFTNNITPSEATVLADLTEATFPGYTTGGVAITTWGAAYLDVDGNAIVDGNEVQFQPSDDTTPETAYGWYLTDGGGTDLLAVGIFVPPIPLPDEFHAARVSPYVQFGS